ncbi:MAG: inositol monophosphatase family protein [Ardenticatenia bacterium]|nr:inositol monophosphatase family protein [Ardenticatenia bacterium]
MDHQLDTLLEFALEAAWEAGRITLGYFQTRLPVELKADASPVTEADRQAERIVRELVARYWPEHGLIGEEFGHERADAEFVWVVDPIDGTKSFITGVPLFGTLVALLRRGEPVLGVLFFPALNDVVYAARGRGCFWNGRRARVSETEELGRARLMASNLNRFARHGKARGLATAGGGHSLPAHLGRCLRLRAGGHRPRRHHGGPDHGGVGRRSRSGGGGRGRWDVH